MQQKNNRKFEYVGWLMLFGMLLVCADIINIDVGGLKLKIAYVGLFFHYAIFLYVGGVIVNKKNLYWIFIFSISVLPSVVLSSDQKVSVAFYFGLIMCCGIMLVFSRMASSIPEKVDDFLVSFYRATIFFTALLVLVGLQERGHFLFYEPSYYAISLIPYFCLVFYRFFNATNKSYIDFIIILLAIILSTSVSMVIWLLMAFFVMYTLSGKARIYHFVAAFLFLVMLMILAYIYHAKTHLIFDKIFTLTSEISSIWDLTIFVVGNRLQRVMVAYQVFMEHPLFGVGLGALKSYSSRYLNGSDFELDGKSAADFDVDMNATNVFLEIGAEAGVFGLVGFLLLLRYVLHSAGKLSFPYRVAVILTMVALLIESSYLRPYVWALYGLAIGLGSQSINFRRSRCR